MDTSNKIFELCDRIRETGLAIHSFLDPGHFEKVYENALINRLQKLGMKVQSQIGLQVCDEDGTLLGEYVADLLIEDCMIIEIKACDTMVEAHTAQLLGYLRASNIKHGLLINFGAKKFFIKKYVL